MADALTVAENWFVFAARASVGVAENWFVFLGGTDGEADDDATDDQHGEAFRRGHDKGPGREHQRAQDERLAPAEAVVDDPAAARLGGLAFVLLANRWRTFRGRRAPHGAYDAAHKRGAHDPLLLEMGQVELVGDEKNGTTETNRLKLNQK